MLSVRNARLAIAAALLAATLGAEAQQPSVKTPRIAFLAGGSRAGDAPYLEAFWRRMKELGYVEGRNIVAEYRFAEGAPERVPAYAAELVRLKVDVIVAPGSGAVAAKKATNEIPIVVTLGDPVGAKLAASFARPGGNVTGLSTQLPELRVKQLDLLREALPKMSRVAAIVSKGSTALGDELRQLEIGAAKVHVAVKRVEISDAGDLERAFSDMTAARTDALLTIRTPLTVVHKSRIIELAASRRIPAIYSDAEFTTAGGLMSYGVNVADLWARAANYVDRILKGANPASLPIAQPEKFDLVINLKTARALGLTIPNSVLQRAERIIE
jgi:putative ABC transport system substrate-binding protein